MFQLFKYQQDFFLESGVNLPGFHLGFTTIGTLNADKSKWWDGLVGENKLFNPAKYFIICVNMPGSCYGSIHPLDVNPTTQQPYYHDFPFFTTRDMIRAYQHLKNYLGIEKIYVGLGGSMGGQQLL